MKDMFKDLLKKESIFWNRTYNMHKKFNTFMKIFPLGFPLCLVLVSICHYCFVFMHVVSYKFKTSE